MLAPEGTEPVDPAPPGNRQVKALRWILPFPGLSGSSHFSTPDGLTSLLLF